MIEVKNKKPESLYLKLMPYFEKYGILLLLLIMILVMHILQPDVFLSWNDRACNDCPYFEFCLCDNKRLSHEKKRKKRR